MRFLTLALALACCGCTCTSPIFHTATRVAELDFSRRASGTLLWCESETFTYSVKVVSP